LNTEDYNDPDRKEDAFTQTSQDWLAQELDTAEFPENQTFEESVIYWAKSRSFTKFSWRIGFRRVSKGKCE
jgi:hypothetical protein